MQTQSKFFMLVGILGVALSGGTANATVQMNTNSGKAAEVVVVHYHKNWDYTKVVRQASPSPYHETSHVKWELNQSGFRVWEKCWGGGYYYVWFDGQWDTNGVGTEIGNDFPDSDCGVKNVDYIVSITAPTGWPGESCTGGQPRPGSDQVGMKWDETVTRDAQTRYELHTGGKKISGRKNLFVLTASAQGHANLYYPEIDTLYSLSEPYPITNSAIVLGDLGPLGNDGVLYFALPDGVTRNVTPTVAGSRYYRYNQPGASKHKLNILANGYPLADDRVRPLAKYCVGQKLNFEAVFVPAVPGLSSASPAWNFTGEYINHHYTDGNGCERYVIAPYWVTQNPTRAWYYNKGDELNANLGMFCTFDNGQSAYVVTRGKFNMFEPSISLWKGGGAAVNVGFSLDCLQMSLMVGNQYGSGSMYFSGIVESKLQFPGEVIATQLIESWWSAIVNNPPVTTGGGTSGAYELDRQEVYPNSHVTLSLNGQGTAYVGDSSVVDQPCLGLSAAQWASRNDSFKTYFRFRPSGAESIYVTLGRVDWNWFGNAEQTAPFTWTLSSGGVTGPNLTPTDEFPEWNEVY